MIKSWSFDCATLWLHREPESALSWADHVSADEIARAATMGSTTRAHTFLSARAALRQHLSSTLSINPTEIEIMIDTDGKPHLPSYSLHFSLSHSAGYILIGIAPIPLGVDIQTRDTAADIEAIAKRMFSADQIAAVANAADPRDMAFKIWCEKEATFKLGQPPRTTNIDTLDEGLTYAVCIA